MASSASSQFYADKSPPLCSLAAHDAWSELTQNEKQYAHWMTKACWAGGDIIRAQWTPTAVKLNHLLLYIFSSSNGIAVDFEQLKADSGLSEDDWQALLDYTVQVLSNLCNYRSFGNTKLIPRVPKAAFEKVVQASPRSQQALPLWHELADGLYSLEPAASLHIGKPADGHVSNYYPDSLPPTDADIAKVLELTDREGISSLNTRLRKYGEDDFTLLIASADVQPPTGGKQVLESNGLKVKLQYGDFAQQLSKVNAALKEAQKHVANDHQRNAIDHYMACFASGDVDRHIEGSKDWVRDAGPVVETYIGHVENYVDPYQKSAEWEGFVSIVDKKLAGRFTALVDSASEVLKTLPWGPQFENDTFHRPDYSGLTILSFATGGIPAGINIPNYSAVRTEVGSKNLSLLNILNATSAKEEIKFVLEEDRALLEEWQGKCFEVQVAHHELLGHGSGKLFRQEANGELNFDRETINPLTGKPVASWYQAGETPNGKIGAVYGACEEMRAEAVAMFLCHNRENLKIFEYTSEMDIETVAYVSYLSMARAGLRSLEYYSPETGKHGQAHMQARHGILRWLVQDGIAQVHIEHEGQTVKNAYITVDRTKVLDGTAKASMGRLLLELQIRRSLGDASGMTEFIDRITQPPPPWRGALRDYVVANRSARKVFIQPNTQIALDGTVEYRDYPVTSEGLIISCIERDESF